MAKKPEVSKEAAGVTDLSSNDGFESVSNNTQESNDGFETIDMGQFEIFEFSKNKEPMIGKSFTGKFSGMRDGEKPENMGIHGLNFTDESGKKKFVISAYYALEKYFSQVSEEDRNKYVYRITLAEVKAGKGQGGSDVFVFDVARKLDTHFGQNQKTA